MRKQILDATSKVLDEIVAIRHQLHQMPESAFEEQLTSALIAEKLKALGLPVTTGLAQTGLMATIQGTSPGNVIALRSDMDALPIQETTAKPHASKKHGCAHSCGHDGHIACLLGAAHVLTKLRDQLSGADPR